LFVLNYIISLNFEDVIIKSNYFIVCKSIKFEDKLNQAMYCIIYS